MSPPFAHTASAAALTVPLVADLTYDRVKDLPRLLRMWPSDVLKLGEEDRGPLVERLRLMLRDERRRGLNRHWSYNLTRHAALLRAYRAESSALSRQRPANTGLAKTRAIAKGPST